MIRISSTAASSGSPYSRAKRRNEASTGDRLLISEACVLCAMSMSLDDAVCWRGVKAMHENSESA